MMYTTYLKNVQTRMKDCPEHLDELQHDKAQCGDSGGVYHVVNGTNLCECTKIQNMYTKGVEQVGLLVEFVPILFYKYHYHH